MKNTLLFVLTAALIPSISLARLSDGKDHLKLSGTKINATLDKGFHFNKEAPAGLYLDGEMGAIEPLKKTEKLIVFDASKAKDKSFTVSFYVCDDAKTVCESHEQHLIIKKNKLQKFEEKKDEELAPKTSGLTPTEKVKAPLVKNDLGFYENPFDDVLAYAKSEDKMLLVDYYAPWCPACIRLENETFSAAEFKEATKEFVKVAVNADKKENRMFGKQYSIPGMPTLLILSPQGAELARLIDFRPATTLVKEINDLKQGKLATEKELIKRADAGDEQARTLLATRAFNAFRFEDAVKWLAPMNKKSKLLTMSEAGYAEAQFRKDMNKNRAPYQVALEKAIDAYPDSVGSVILRNDLINLMKGEEKEAPDKAKEIAKKNIAVIDALLKNEQTAKEAFVDSYIGDYTGFEVAKLWAEKYNCAKILGDSSLKKKAQKEVSKLVKPALDTAKPGTMLAGLGLLKNVELMDEALAGVEKLAAAYPKSEVYQQKAAFSLTRAKKFDKALPYSEKVVAMESDSAFYNLKNLAEVYKGLDRKKDALATVEKALNLPEAKTTDYKEAVSALEEMKKTLQ